MLTPAVLAAPRAAADRELMDSCVISARSLPDDGEGGQNETYTARGSAEPCSYSVLAGRELERAAQVAAEADVVVKLQAHTLVVVSDRITITNAETAEVTDVEVLHVNKRSLEIRRRVLCKDVTPTI